MKKSVSMVCHTELSRVIQNYPCVIQNCPCVILNLFQDLYHICKKKEMLNQVQHDGLQFGMTVAFWDVGLHSGMTVSFYVILHNGLSS